MNIYLAYIILNNRYAIQTRRPKYLPNIEGLVSNYCSSTRGCDYCDLNQDLGYPKFTSDKYSCYRGFLTSLYFSGDQ